MHNFKNWKYLIVKYFLAGQLSEVGQLVEADVSFAFVVPDWRISRVCINSDVLLDV
jgi:hypothetical protein